MGPQGKPKVIYSIGAKFAGSGIGTTAYYGALGLHRHGMLKKVLCGSFRPSEIPSDRIKALGLPSRVLRKLATFDNSRWLWYLQAVLYDAWASTQLEPADVLIVWGNYALRTIRRAKELGLTTVLVRASTHPRYQARLLAEEYERWGLDFRINEASLRRAVEEISLADYVLIPSDFVRRSFLEEGYPEEKLIQIPFGVDLDRFRPAERKEPHPFRALFVGQVSIRKGVPYLLEAWRRLGWDDAELWLVGMQEKAARKVWDSFREVPGVRWLGHRDPLPCYQAADVFVFPSIEEGSALVTYEAMACGLPVITTPNAGSVVRDGVEGFIVPIRKVKAIVMALQRLYLDEQLRWKMSKAAQTRAGEFSWHRHGDSLVQSFI